MSGRTLLLAVATGIAVALPLLAIWLAPTPTPADSRTAPGQNPVARIGAIERLEPVAFGPIDEMSGIVASRIYPGSYWVHNDSGDAPRLFAIDQAGHVIIPPFLSARYHGEGRVAGRAEWPGVSLATAANMDWEDIALADGKLYIGDIGNNGNARRDLGIYVLNEPNPRTLTAIRPLAFWPVRYPEQTGFPPTDQPWNYDAESLFVDGGKPYIITKHRPTGRIRLPAPGAVLYRLDTFHTDRENDLVRVDARDDIMWATGADLSPDGRHLAMIAMNALWVFERPADGDAWLTGGNAFRLDLPMPLTRQVEAVCWETDDTIRFTNEQRDVFRVARSDIPPATD